MKVFVSFCETMQTKGNVLSSNLTYVYLNI